MKPSKEKVATQRKKKRGPATKPVFWRGEAFFVDEKKKTFWIRG